MEPNAQNLPVVIETTEKGRPTKYKPEYVEQVYRMALLGLTDEEIADVLGVTRSTFNNWKKQHPEFLDTVKRGKILADANVSASLYKRAVGYEYPSEKLMTVSRGDGVSEVERHSITVHVIPDPGACMNWLKNRQPNLWSDKQKHELSGDFTFTLNLDGEQSTI